MKNVIELNRINFERGDDDKCFFFCTDSFFSGILCRRRPSHCTAEAWSYTIFHCVIFIGNVKRWNFRRCLIVVELFIFNSKLEIWLNKIVFRYTRCAKRDVKEEEEEDQEWGEGEEEEEYEFLCENM